MKSLLLYLCISYITPLCSVEHDIVISNYGNNAKVKFEISKINVLKNYKEKGKYLLLFNLNIHNLDSDKISFMYSDLMFSKKEYKDKNIQPLPQASLFTSIAPIPMEILANKKMELELYIVIDNLKTDYDFMGINFKTMAFQHLFP